MLTYAKFLKDIILHWRKLNSVDHVVLDAIFSAVIQRSMPKKAKDDDSFTISIFVGDTDIHDVFVF